MRILLLALATVLSLNTNANTCVNKAKADLTKAEAGFKAGKSRPSDLCRAQSSYLSDIFGCFGVGAKLYCAKLLAKDQTCLQLTKEDVTKGLFKNPEASLKAQNEIIGINKYYCRIYLALEGGSSSGGKCKTGMDCPGSEVCVKRQCQTQGAPSDGTAQCSWNGDCSFPTPTCIGGVCSR